MWPNRQETVDLVTFTEEILNGKLHFLCNVVTSTSIGTTSACITSSKTFILLSTSAASAMATIPPIYYIQPRNSVEDIGTLTLH